MNPTVFAMRHPITTLTLVVALISGGALAYTKMRVDIFPSLNVPKIYVFLDYVGMSPGQMAGFIVIQDELGSDSGVAVAALNPDRADAGSIESHVGLKPVAGAQAGTDSHEVERETPIAGALASIEECQRRYRTIRDYTCTFSTRERIKGRLTPLHVLMMKVRTQPRSIYVKFRQPSPGAKPSTSSGATTARSWSMMWG